MKRVMPLIVGVIMLAGLTGAYFYLRQRNAAAEAEATPEPPKSVTLLNYQESDIKSVTFYSSDTEITLTPVQITPEPESEESSGQSSGQSSVPEITWRIKGMEELTVNATMLKDMARNAFSLTATEKIRDTVENPEEFLLDPPVTKVVVTYQDAEKTILVGAKTPGDDNYYVMIGGDPALYLVSGSVGANFSRTHNELVDKTLPAIDTQKLEYVYVHQKGKEPVEFAFEGPANELQEQMAQYGGVALTMRKPYVGRQLNVENFSTNVLNKMSGITMGNLIALEADNPADYGLDDPELEVWLKDSAGEMHLQVGAERDANTVFVKYFDRPEIFAMNKTYLFGFYDMNLLSFMDRFVSLVYIDNCDGVTIQAADGLRFDTQIIHELIPVTPKPTPTPAPDETPDPQATPEPTPAPEKKLRPSVNGTAVQEAAFKTYYQALIGLSYDSAINGFTPDSEPEVVITYEMNNGEPNPTFAYYNYNADFYAVRQDDLPIQFVVNKLSVEQMFASMKKLLAGELDR